MTSSLRRRIFVGSVLWTIGMIILSGAAFSLIAESNGHLGTALRLHGWIRHRGSLAIGVIGLVVGALYVRRGLASIDLLRSRLTGVRDGHGGRLDGAYPAEVQPLVDDLNALLAHRDRAIRRAAAKAGDLAHNLKTPLAVLAREAERAAAAGQSDVAASIDQQVGRMQRQVNYHLAHARAAASGATPGARMHVRESADGLARTLLRLHAGRDLAIDVDVPPDHTVRARREDVDEMLGNLLDNASRFARGRVVISSTHRGPVVVISVDDDGPGLAEELREKVVQRGVRADEAAPGSGLGLAIVRDLVELYGGTIALDCSPLGGLRASVELPS